MGDMIRDYRTENRPLGFEQVGLVSTFILIIIFAAFYSLTKTVSDLATEVDALQKQLKDLTDAFTSNKVPNKEFQMVAFSARIKSSFKDIQPWATIVFSDVETNVGVAYHGKTGEFSAPRAGLYVFFGHVLSKEGRNIETALSVNGDIKLWFYAGGTSAFHGTGSNLLVVHLQRGDKVKMVKYGQWGTSPFYIHNVFSTFSGFLLRADD